MAEFGVQATQLSAPQGAGANPVAPVETINPLAPLVNAAGGVLDIVAKGLKANQKEEAEKRKQAIISGYVKTETKINDAVSTGQMTPAQASARSRANFNQYAAGFSEYIEEFEKAGKALRGFTEKGEVEDAIKAERVLRDRDVTQAQQRGFTFVPGMTKAQEDAQIEASKTGIRAEQMLSNFYKSQDELRASGRYNEEIAKRDAQNLSVTLITEIAGSNIQAFQQFGASLGEQVRSGKMDPQNAQVVLAERYSNIQGAIAAAARTNPELSGPYRTLFNELNVVNQKLIDPKSNAEEVENQLKVILGRAKLLAVSSDPKVKAAVVASQLLPNSVEVALQVSPQVNEIFAKISSMPPDMGTPQVVANPAVEGDVLKLLKESLKGMKGKNVTDHEVANVQAANSVNAILKQTGDLVNKGVTPKQLSNVASFLASPEYGEYVKNGQVNAEANATAKKVFQLSYEPTITRGIQQQLDTFLYGQASFAKGAKQPAPKKIADVVDIQFNGSGVSFKAKPTEGLDPVERASQASAVADLKVAEAAINQLVRMGAHMEGTTDYAKHWKENKHIYMPNVYPQPGRLKVGDVVDGYEYFREGDYSDPRNWRPKSGN
jgi:hypothetical protein